MFNRIKFEDIKPTIDDIVAHQKAENAPVIEFKEVEPITIDDFAKVQMKIGVVLECEAVPKSKLLHSTVRVGTKTLSILSGIAKAYTPEQMTGKYDIILLCFRDANVGANAEQEGDGKRSDDLRLIQNYSARVFC